jgi:hypothetical protein
MKLVMMMRVSGEVLYCEIYLFILEELFGDFEDLETGEKSKEDKNRMDDEGKQLICLFDILI